jgi:hypothetical protein
MAPKSRTNSVASIHSAAARGLFLLTRSVIFSSDVYNVAHLSFTDLPAAGGRVIHDFSVEIHG